MGVATLEFSKDKETVAINPKLIAHFGPMEGGGTWMRWAGDHEGTWVDQDYKFVKEQIDHALIEG